jgi:hypothetical protein
MTAHASATTTWDRYGHLHDDLDTVAARLENARLAFLRTACGQLKDNEGRVASISEVG